MPSARQMEKQRAYEDIEYEQEQVLLGFDDEQRPNIRYYSASPDGSDLSSSLRSRPASPSLELLEDAPHSGSSDDVIFVEHNPAMARTASAMSQASTGSAAAAAALTPAGSHSQAASISPARAIAPLPHGLPAKPNEAVIAASGSPVKHASPARSGPLSFERPNSLGPPPARLQPLSYERPTPSAHVTKKRKLSYDRPANAQVVTLVPQSYPSARPSPQPAPIKASYERPRPLIPKAPLPSPLAIDVDALTFDLPALAPQLTASQRRIAQPTSRRPLIGTPNKKVGRTLKELPYSPRAAQPNHEPSLRARALDAQRQRVVSMAIQTNAARRFVSAAEVQRAKEALLKEGKRKRKAPMPKRGIVEGKKKKESLPEEYQIKGGVGSLVGNEAGRDVYLRALYQLQRQMFARGGAVVAIDFEGYQAHHDRSVVQAGLVVLEWTRDEKKKLVESKEYRHYCSEYSSLTPIRPLNNFGKTEQLPLAEIVTRVRARLQALVDRKVHCLIVLHDQTRDAECLRHIFGIPAEWLELFGTKTPVRQVVNVDELDEHEGTPDAGPPFRVVDTQQLFAIIRRINYKVALRRCCQSTKAIPPEKLVNFHNATNDADFTIKLYIRLYDISRREIHEADRKEREASIAAGPSTSKNVIKLQKKVPLPAVIIDVDALVAGGESGGSEDEGDDDSDDEAVLVNNPTRQLSIASSSGTGSIIALDDDDDDDSSEKNSEEEDAGNKEDGVGGSDDDSPPPEYRRASTELVGMPFTFQMDVPRYHATANDPICLD